MAQAGQESRPLESIRSWLNNILRWGEQRLLLSHCCGLTWWLLCSANAAKIPLGRSHRCGKSRQPGGRRQSSRLIQAASALGSHRGCSSSAQRLLTKTQLRKLQGWAERLQWQGFLNVLNQIYHLGISTDTKKLQRFFILLEYFSNLFHLLEL